MKQSDAVYKVTLEVLASSGITFVPGETIVHDVVTKDIRSDIAAKLVTLFQEGQVEFKDSASNQAKLSDPKLLKTYINGLITNWHNKDKRLNANAKYEPKNPGSRQGNQDSVVKEMRTLLKHLEEQGDETSAARVRQAIDERIQEIKSAKSPTAPTIDLDKIPEHLRDLVS